MDLTIQNFVFNTNNIVVNKCLLFKQMNAFQWSNCDTVCSDSKLRFLLGASIYVIPVTNISYLYVQTATEQKLLVFNIDASSVLGFESFNLINWSYSVYSHYNSILGKTSNGMQLEFSKIPTLSKQKFFWYVACL